MSKKSSSPEKISKKQTRELVYNKLASALAEYKISMKEKKFLTNLKKASKLFADEIIKHQANHKVKRLKKEGKKKKGLTVEVV